MTPRRTHVAETAIWWVLLAALWLLVAPTPSPPEIVLAAVAAVPCAVAATVTRRVLAAGWRVERRWWRRVAPLVVGAVRETAALLGRAPRAVVTRVDLDRGRDAATRAGREAAATIALSATPGSVVLDAGPDAVTIHRVAGRPFPGERAEP
ncbi:MAG: hypothetical protein J0I34_18985 [Pseudonocardia sp.]|uniref:hypothetical protein n=1 Tax=unclassified Pseudonocardia TaxID=2619320 RepID=UPI00086F7A0E|nr:MULTISPECIES: hypothetical protein [unclassified Pseudonocardia]MBN9110853.1 hypothetical protein [Pseudonocardia sp.]ODU26847.1 MAG: hypothetical protein ABS80_05705 [Pseudonocardia sp. SCN 72-51]ODV05432.1 MAG: hypothetical protein ABT15_17270 [Pseudonocardia sp. SCN 73-27]